MAEKDIKPVNPAPVALQPLFNFSLRAKYVFLALTGFIFYANSILNKYAFDDAAVILQNRYVQMGFSGIPKIISNDSYASYSNYLGGDPSSAQLSGGRFRPLSEIIFAIEQSALGGLGNSTLLPYFRHLINVLAYMACIMAIFYFLEKNLLKKMPYGSDMAFLATFLFAIHPLHTEVVANIKSFDEILSLLFIMLTFIFSLKYFCQGNFIGQNRQTKYLVIGAGSFFLALLSKEYAITLVFFIPFLFYLMEDKKLSSAIIAGIPYYGVFAVYLLLRYTAVGFHSNIQSFSPLNNPYLYAAPIQKIATEWFVLGKYLGLLFFPYPLSCDYSYCQIKYHDFSDITALLSLLVYTGIFVWGIRLIGKKSVLSFAVFFFLFNIFMISNFALNIGATMGERLVFHSSLGFVIILSYFLFKVSSKMTLQAKKSIAIGAMSVTGIVCFGETIMRNAQWKDDTSLFIHDVGVVPNSCLANNNAGFYYIGLSGSGKNTGNQSKAYLDSARKYLFRALHIYKDYDNARLNSGLMYIHLGMPDSAKYCWDMAKKLSPSLPALATNYALLSQHYFVKGLDLCKNGKLRQGIIYMRKALSIDSESADKWYNTGVSYFRMQQYDSARYSFLKSLQYNPDSLEAAGAKTDLNMISQMKEQ